MNNKTDFIDRIKADLDEWDADIAQLQAEAHKVHEKRLQEYRELIEQLKQKKELARKTLGEIEEAGDDVWERLKDVVEDVRKDVKSVIKETKAEYHKGLKGDE